MALRLSSGGAGRRRPVAVQIIIVFCALSCPVREASATHISDQATPSREASGQFRFQVTDSDTDLPIPSAAISLIYWEKKESGEERKEIERKTDRNGIAEFPRVKADKLAATVTVKGYRPYWRWLRPNQAAETTRIRVEKWARKAK